MKGAEVKTRKEGEKRKGRGEGGGDTTQLGKSPYN